jgi:hypothetical protein
VGPTTGAGDGLGVVGAGLGAAEGISEGVDVGLDVVSEECIYDREKKSSELLKTSRDIGFQNFKILLLGWSH